MYRVTEVIGYHPAPFLIKWREKHGDKYCDKVRKEALHNGTVIDNLVQDDINKPALSSALVGYPGTESGNCMVAWGSFKAKHPDVFELMVKYKENMQKELILGDLVGHPDFILSDEIIDLKTSKQVDMSHWMQVAQYAYMTNQLTTDTTGKRWIDKISILRLDKYDETGKFEYVSLEEPFISFWQKEFH